MRRIVAGWTMAMLGLGNPLLMAAQTAPQSAPVLATAPAQTPSASQVFRRQQQPGQQSAPSDQGAFTLTVNANIVLTNVVVRDKKTGALITGLKASDFTIVEDKKKQNIVSFDYQNVDNAAALADAQETATVSGQQKIANLLENNFAAAPAQLRDHRLIVIFFDLSSMQDDDIDRAVDAADDYVNKSMQPADLVALVSMSTGLSMDQDFTSDKAALLRGLSKYNGTDTTGFANGTTGSTDATSDDTTTFAADDSEYNSLNTDRELLAIRAIAKSLERVDQRKSMLYFSGGLTKNGIENQASLRAATNEAAKANMAIYSVDTRGLQALPPVGDASKGSIRGNSAYSGKAVQAQFNANYASQETLNTLSSDTGGKAFFDSNDFGPAFQQVQHDTEAYYILGFHSTNPARDGAFRHLTITVNNKDAKIEYRPGYFAPADFQHQKTEDRELALTEQMRSDSPATDVSLYMQALYFRQSDTLFYIPVSLIVPGSQIPFTSAHNTDKASIDILGQVKNGQGLTVGNIRDTVKLNLDASQEVARKNIQYSTGFTLAPGKYHLKFVVRENQSGNMGSFETDIQVPDLKKLPLKLSSVVMSSQRTPSAPVKGSTVNPNLLVRDGLEWVPNVPHVFRQDQHLYFLYEVYDPTKVAGAAAPASSPGLGRREGGPVHVLTSIEFLSGGTKVFETPLVTADVINVPDRGAVAFQFDVPLAQLKTGTYICQINVIDDAGGSFSFPRMAMKVTGAAVAVTPAPTTTSPAPVTSPSVAPTPEISVDVVCRWAHPRILQEVEGFVMRMRVVFFGVMSVALLPVSGVCAAIQQSPQTVEARPAPALAVMTSPEERALLHSGPDWALIEPHLPDPDTASAAELEAAADILLARRFPEDSLDYYGYAMARGGNVSELLNKMGIVRLDLRQIGLAHEMFQQTVKVQKKNAAAWNNLGVTEYQLKHFGKAVEDYSKAAKLDKQKAVYHSNLGIAYFEMKDLESAQTQFAEATKLDPHIMDPKDGSGSLAQVVGNENYGGLCFQMATAFAHEKRTAQMLLWLAKASEAGFDVKEGMLNDAALAQYEKDPRVRMILTNTENMHKKTLAAAKVPALGSATPQ